MKCGNNACEIMQIDQSTDSVWNNIHIPAIVIMVTVRNVSKCNTFNVKGLSTGETYAQKWIIACIIIHPARLIV
jgi:hypothetical protein